MKMEEERMTTPTDDGQSTKLQDQNSTTYFNSKDLKALFWHQHHDQYWGSVCQNMGPLNG